MLRTPSCQGRVPNADAIHATVNNHELQLGMLNCAAELVLGAFSSRSTFPSLTVELARIPKIIDLWAATDCFWLHLGGPSQADMPEDIASLLGYMR